MQVVVIRKQSLPLDGNIGFKSSYEESYFRIMPKDKLTIDDRIRLASAVVAPIWPAHRSILCNPLLYLEEKNFWEALEIALGSDNLIEGEEDFTAFVNRQMIKWIQSFLDEGISRIRMPCHKNGFYKAWKDLARFDLELITSRDARCFFLCLPDTASDAVTFVLESLRIPEELIDDFLSTQISQLPGWAGYIRVNQESISSNSISLTEFLAVRLGIYFIACHKNPPKWVVLNSSNPGRLRIERERVLNGEKSFSRDLVHQILAVLKKPKNKRLPDAQWIFCIDSRSEPFRFLLESIGNYETFGCAGLFGFPAVISSQEGKTSLCPVFVKPKWEFVAESDKCGFFNKISQYLQHLVYEIFPERTYRSGNVLSCFEPFGFCIGIWVALKSLWPCFGNYLSNNTLASVNTNLDLTSIPFQDRVDTAEALLRLMGMCYFSPLVVICGHGSTSCNNPFSSFFNCSACGSNRGAWNASFLASVLNSKPVRVALNERGIKIPDKTLFIGAEHDTVTDEVCFFDDLQHTGKELEVLKENIRKVSRKNRKRRHRLFKEKSRFSNEAVIMRSTDWSETQPEWGLVNNAAFLVGPRTMSLSLDLQGRAFLHSYDWEGDSDSTYLEKILTSSLVVVEWINMKYFCTAIDPVLYSSGSRTTQNIVGKIGVMQGNGSDLMNGLPTQSVFASDGELYHEPLRLLTLVFAPLQMVDCVIERNSVLQKLLYNEWVNMIVINPEILSVFQFDPMKRWVPFEGLL